MLLLITLQVLLIYCFKCLGVQYLLSCSQQGQGCVRTSHGLWVCFKHCFKIKPVFSFARNSERPLGKTGQCLTSRHHSWLESLLGDSPQRALGAYVCLPHPGRLFPGDCKKQRGREEGREARGEMTTLGRLFSSRAQHELLEKSIQSDIFLCSLLVFS